MLEWNTLKQKFLEKESVIKRASLEPFWLGTALWALIFLSSFAFYSPSSPPATLCSLSQPSLLCEPLLSTHAPSLLQAASLSVGWPTIKLHQVVSSVCFTRLLFVVLSEYREPVLCFRNLILTYCAVLERTFQSTTCLYTKKGNVRSASEGRIIALTLNYGLLYQRLKETYFPGAATDSHRCIVPVVELKRAHRLLVETRRCCKNVF